MSPATHQFLVFVVFNVLCWQSLIGTTLVLHARALGIDAGWIGILSALQVLRTMHARNATLAQLAAVMQEYPSQLANMPVVAKPPLESLPKLQKLMVQAHKEFGEHGRHLIRYSGTENKIRVLVEHKEVEQVHVWVSKFATVIRDEIR